MRLSRSASLVLSFSIGLMTLASTERADRDKAIVIEAATLRMDDAKQITKASGNVVMTKGSMVVRAENIEVREDPDGYYFARISGTRASPPSFRQKREALDEFIEGEADLIEYDGRADTVKFVRNAVLRRLRGTSLADEIGGGLIVYENLLDRFHAEGGSDTVGGTSRGGRVHMMLVPKPDASAPRSPPPEQSNPPLQAAPTLETLPK